MKGWFDAFRTEGGPTIYAYSNRTSVTGDLPTITIAVFFLTFFLAFIALFPGVRKERFSTFCSVSLSLFVGCVILVCNYGSAWQVTEGEIVSSYRAFSRDKIHAWLGVNVGLDHANVTLKVIPQSNRSLDINFNERLQWDRTDQLQKQYKEGLVKGLPYPILTVVEYLAMDNEGFAWGRHYREAGYYASICLWSAFACWLLMNLLLVHVPRYGAYMMSVTGATMQVSCAVYYLLVPPMPLVLRFEDAALSFRLGWCFWLVLVSGGIILASGLVVALIDCIYPHTFSTIVEVDFDTPYDRHIIIEESVDTRKRRFKIPKLEEPINAGLNAGSRLLRRLSKRGNNGTDEIEPKNGVDNLAYEMEPPKSPWRHQIGSMMRTDSKKSTKSVNFRSASTRSQRHLEIPHPNFEENLTKLQRSDSKQSSSSSISSVPTAKSVNFQSDLEDSFAEATIISVPSMKRQDSEQSCASSSSSYGIGGLLRNPSVRRISQEEIENTHPPVCRNNSGNIIVFHRTDSRGQLQRISTGENPNIAVPIVNGEPVPVITGPH